MTPWEHHPALKSERLIHIAELIQNGRNFALDHYYPEIGCDGWTTGCEAFAFQKYQIIESAQTIEWLSILDRSMQFVFAIDGVPIRFYRGEANEPHKRTLQQTFVELKQYSLFSSEELVKLSNNPLYRFAVETDFEGSITAIIFVMLDGEDPVVTWEIPLDSPVSKVAPLWTEENEGVKLSSPSIGVPNKRQNADLAD